MFKSFLPCGIPPSATMVFNRLAVYFRCIYNAKYVDKCMHIDALFTS